MTESVPKDRNYIVDPITGDVIDPETGEVIEDHIVSTEAEWRAYNTDEWSRRSRASGRVRLALHDCGLHSYVNPKPFRTGEVAKALKLRLLNERVRVSKKDRNLVNALATMWSVAKSLGLPEEVIETAGSVLRKLHSAKPIRDNVMMETVIAALIESAKMHGLPVRIKEIAKRYAVNERKLWLALREIAMNGLVKNIAVNPRKYLARFSSSLGLSQSATLLASRIIERLEKANATQGKDPSGIAAAALYVASILLDEKRPQKEVAKATGVTEVTIRNRYRDIVDKLVIEVKL